MKHFIYSFVAYFLLVPYTYSQQSKTQQVENNINFMGGINSAYPSNIIDASEAQSAQNVFYDNGALEKRGGSRKQNNSAIGGGSADVNNVFEYKKSDGTDYCVAFSSTNGYYSTDNCASFTSFFSSFTANNDINCVPFSDRLYCVNGVDTSFYFDGTSYKVVSNMPIGKYLRAYQNRLWVAGVANQKSYIYFSAVNDATNWDTTFGWVGFNPEDGDVVTGIGEPIYEVLPVYKKYSAWTVQGNNADNYTPVIVNNSIGATHHRTIRNFLLKNSKTLQLFDSLGIKGGEPGVYSFNGIVIEYLSDKIKNEVLNLDTFHSVDRYKQWHTASDWGTGTTVFTSSYTDLGVIEPQSFSTTTTSALDWSLGTFTSWVSTNGISGALTLKQSTFTLSNMGAEVSSYTNVTSNSGWARVSTQAYSGSYSWLTFAGIYGIELTVNIEDENGVNVHNSVGYATEGAGWVTWTISGLPTNHQYLVTKITSGDGSFVPKRTIVFKAAMPAPIFVFATKNYDAGGGQFYLAFDVNENFVSSGTYVSKVFDTGLSTTIGGPFSVTFSTVDVETAFYYVRESSKTSPYNWSDWTATSDTLRIPLTKEYWQYKIDYAAVVATHTPIIYDVTLVAASTGYWTSPETLLDANMGSWGLFQSAEITSGKGAWSYQIRASTYVGGTTNQSWSAVTNNTLIGISTGAYVQVRATSSIGSSTDTAKIDSITINYNVGSSARSATAEVYRNRYYWFAQSQNGTSNDIVYVMDSNGAWTKLKGINARSSALIKGNLYTGGSSDGFIRKQDTGYDDDSATIDSYWQSKDYLFGSDDFLKSVDNIYVTYPSNNSNLTTSLYADGALAKSWDIQLSTSASFGVKPMSSMTTTGIKRGKYFNVKFSNNSVNNWKIYGYRLYWTPLQVIQP